jgi:hypothetical protein
LSLKLASWELPDLYSENQIFIEDFVSKKMDKFI